MNIGLYNNGDWGLGIGDWGLGIGDWAQSPIPKEKTIQIIKINKFNFYLNIYTYENNIK